MAVVDEAAWICIHCGARFVPNAFYAGQSIECPKCGEAFQTPGKPPPEVKHARWRDVPGVGARQPLRLPVLTWIPASPIRGSGIDLSVEPPIDLSAEPPIDLSAEPPIEPEPEPNAEPESEALTRVADLFHDRHRELVALGRSIKGGITGLIGLHLFGFAVALMAWGQHAGQFGEPAPVVIVVGSCGLLGGFGLIVGGLVMFAFGPDDGNPDD